MIWGFVLWGQPPTVNHLHEPAWREDSHGRRYRGLRKTDAARKYQDDAVLVIRAAKPSRWAPETQIRVLFSFYLARDADCDNTQKVINDALEQATGVNDKRFLPCVQLKEVVPPKEARVEVFVEDPSSPLWAPGRSPGSPASS